MELKKVVLGVLGYVLVFLVLRNVNEMFGSSFGVGTPSFYAGYKIGTWLRRIKDRV
jgi:hypothetical protein